MILTDLSNTIKKLWKKISFHKHFKLFATVYIINRTLHGSLRYEFNLLVVKTILNSFVALVRKIFVETGTKLLRPGIHSQKCESCNKPVDILRQNCYEQADIRMRSHGLQKLVGDKSVASSGFLSGFFVEKIEFR